MSSAFFIEILVLVLMTTRICLPCLSDHSSMLRGSNKLPCFQVINRTYDSAEDFKDNKNVNISPSLH